MTNTSTHRKSIRSWIMYDWANSAFATTVMAGFFPLFFKQYWSAGQDATLTTAKLGTVLSISGLIIAILSPILGALADMRGMKKMFCALAMFIGAGCCLWMAFIPKGEWHQAMWAYGIGMVAYIGSTAFYDSLLPSLARGTEMDDVSSRGYAMGYLGGGVLFILNVIMFLMPTTFGFAEGDDGKVQAVKASFASVTVWWLLFSIPMWRNVPEPTSGVGAGGFMGSLRRSITGLSGTIGDLWQDRNLFLSLVAYWLYIDGVYTVMTMAVDYGLAIGLESSGLITALLMVQFIGFPCTWMFGKLTGRFGCRLPILFCIGVYSVTVVAATWMSETWHFYLLAAVIGSVQGGVQSLSRSLFGNMIPQERSGEYFGFFNLVGRFASILGPFIVALTVMLTRNSRVGLMGLLILFVVGGALLWMVKEPGRLSKSRPAGAQ